MHIRPLEEKDIPAAGDIVRQNYDANDEQSVVAETRDMFVIGPIRPKYFVAEDNGEIVGLAGYMQSWIDYAVYQIFWVNVVPHRQRQGIGTQLVRAVIEKVTKDPQAKQLLLTATSPEYYNGKFGFKSIDSFKGKNHVHFLMSLTLRE